MRIKGPTAFNPLLRQHKLLHKAGNYAMLRPRMVQIYRLLELQLEQLNEFPLGQEFYGRLTSVHEDKTYLQVKLEALHGREKVVNGLAATLSLADRFGELLDLPPLFIEATTIGPGGHLELVLEKPGNILGQNLGISSGAIMTTNRFSLPFKRKIRTQYDENNITVYQAFRPEIAEEAVAEQSFGPSFSRERTTWIKPSFLWLMKRSDWGTAQGQERILAIELDRAVFEELLSNAVLSQPVIGLSHPNLEQYRSAAQQKPNRVQWDPEKSIQGARLPQRSLQLGLHQSSLDLYLKGIRSIKDITERTAEIRQSLAKGIRPEQVLPHELPYPTPLDLLRSLEMHQFFAGENPEVINAALGRLA